jgi:hypothetical protein
MFGDLHLEMLLHLELTCSEMLTWLPAVEEAWDRLVVELYLEEAVVVIEEGCCRTGRLVNLRIQAEEKREVEEGCGVEERRLGGWAAWFIYLLLQSWKTLKIGSQ